MIVSKEEAVALLRQSQPVAIPTETVWGLAARFSDQKAIEKIFTLKGRPRTNPLIIHVSSIDMVKEVTPPLPSQAELLMKSFWPGSLTLVLPILEDRILDSVRASLPMAAFRIPNNSDTLSLIDQAGPLVAPSANISGRPSATTPQHVEHDFGVFFPILSSQSSCDKGIESTIVIWKDGAWHLGRPGAVNIVDIEDILETPICDLHTSIPLCPGQKFRHYAPQAELHLKASSWEPDESYDGVLGFEDRAYPKAPALITMGFSTDPSSVAKRLYAALREIDDLGLTSVFVDADFPQTVQWRAVLDRLHKATQG